MVLQRQDSVHNFVAGATNRITCIKTLKLLINQIMTVAMTTSKFSLQTCY